MNKINYVPKCGKNAGYIKCTIPLKDRKIEDFLLKELPAQGYVFESSNFFKKLTFPKHLIIYPNGGTIFIGKGKSQNLPAEYNIFIEPRPEIKYIV